MTSFWGVHFTWMFVPWERDLQLTARFPRSRIHFHWHFFRVPENTDDKFVSVTCNTLNMWNFSRLPWLQHAPHHVRTNAGECLQHTCMFIRVSCQVSACWIFGGGNDWSHDCVGCLSWGSCLESWLLHGVTAKVTLETLHRGVALQVKSFSVSPLAVN